MDCKTRKRKAIQAAFEAKLNDNYLNIDKIEKRKELESKYKVSLFIEPHAISAWTKRTPITTWFA